MKDSERNNAVHIYVDGTYHPSKGMGYGFVVFDSGQKAILHQESQRISNREYFCSTNCGAEILGVIRAVLWAEQRGYKFVNIHHDYSGIRTLSRHRRPGHRHPLFNFYKTFIKARMGFTNPGKMMVFLHQVRGHTGILGNEVADRLARAAILPHNSWYRLLQRWYGIARNSLPLLMAEAFLTHNLTWRTA